MDSKRNSLLPILGFFLIALAGAGIYFVSRRETVVPASRIDLSAGKPSGSPSPSPSPMPVKSPHSVSVEKVFQGKQAVRWKEFQNEFGNELKADFGVSGYLESLRGAPRSGRSAGPGFSIRDSEASIRRARDVIEAARELMGVQPEFPLTSPIAHTSEVSSQVTFRETLGDIPVAPRGTVTVDLGARGEVLGVSSDYVHNIHIVNTRNLDPEVAKTRAVAAIPDVNPSISPSDGRPVIWVAGSAGKAGSVEGRHAFEYTVQGRQVIVDASNGEILHRRDRRDF